MNFVSREAAVGAFIAAALMVGANAGQITQPSAPSHAVLTIGAQGSVAVLREHIAVVAGRVLDDALDDFGEIAARLKQM
jgi:hypothetical protein